MLAVWYLLPLVALTALRMLFEIHYLIVLFPLPSIGLALVAERLVRYRAAAGWVALGFCLCSFAYFDGRFLQTIEDNGGAPGDYGVGYRYKADAAAMFVRQNPGRSVEIHDFDPHRSIREFQFLVWNARPAAAPRKPPAVGYVVINTFQEHPGVSTSIHGSSTERFGPLEIVSISK